MFDIRNEHLYPYHSILGFSVESEEEFDASVESLLKQSPQLVTVLKPYVTEIKDLVDQFYEMDLNKFAYIPIINKMTPVASMIGKKSEVDEAITAIDDVLLVVPDVVGATDPKTYLLLFQNDKELRPTGGFITAYADMRLDAGKINVSGSDSIYEISEADSAKYQPPWPIQTYLNQPVWHLRDMNFSPDYPTSMDDFYNYWLTLGQPQVDGIISIDTQFVEKLLEIIGDVKVEGYDYSFEGWVGLPEACRTGGEYFTKNNAVCRLEAYAEKVGLNSSERKSVIGELMGEMLKTVLNTKGDKVLDLIPQVITELNEKHLLLSFEDEDVQSFVESFDWAGRVDQGFEGDYLYINDANLGGLKSDLYLVRSVKQEYSKQDGVTTKTVYITYENTGAFDGWLNATARNYMRVYVPLGSQLLSVDGGEFEPNIYEEFGYTVFDNFVRIPSLSSKTIAFTYTLPAGLGDVGELLIQKQPGVEVVYHTIVTSDGEQAFNLRKDENVSIKL